MVFDGTKTTIYISVVGDVVQQIIFKILLYSKILTGNTADGY